MPPHPIPLPRRGEGVFIFIRCNTIPFSLAGKIDNKIFFSMQVSILTSGLTRREIKGKKIPSPHRGRGLPASGGAEGDQGLG
jgi:hypothetical protein